MSIDIATFRLRFPEFSDDTEYTDARIQLFIDDSVLHIGSDETRWCNKYDLAQAYLTAHLLIAGTKTEAGDISASAGSIKSKSAGGVSVTRGSVDKDLSSGDNFYMNSAYGQQFIAIRNPCFIGVMVASQL